MALNKCPHKRVQEYSECCLDCGRNVYETDEEYADYLLREEAERLAEIKEKQRLARQKK